MISFLIAHWDWIVAGFAGHFGLSGASSIVTWVRAEYAKFQSAIAAVEKAAAPPAAPKA